MKTLTELSHIAGLCQSFLTIYEHYSRRERAEELIRQLHRETGPGEIEQACLKLQAAAQGPGIRSEAFAEALGKVFALLPDNTPAIGIQVEDTFAMEGKAGG